MKLVPANAPRGKKYRLELIFQHGDADSTESAYVGADTEAEILKLYQAAELINEADPSDFSSKTKFIESLELGELAEQVNQIVDEMPYDVVYNGVLTVLDSFEVYENGVLMKVIK